MDFMNLSWYYYIDQKKDRVFPQSYDKEGCGRCDHSTLPNVGTALFGVCVEEKQ